MLGDLEGSLVKKLSQSNQWQVYPIVSIGLWLVGPFYYSESRNDYDKIKIHRYSFGGAQEFWNDTSSSNARKATREEILWT